MTPTGESPPSRREAKKQATRKRILEAATVLFVQRGYDNTTVEEISRQAGITKPTFFSYFPAKSMVLAALMETSHEHFMVTAKTQLRKDASTPDRLSQLFEETGALLQPHSQLSRAVLSQSFQLFTEDSKGSGQRYSELNEMIGELISDGRRRGEVEGTTELESQIKLVTGMYLSTLLEWLSKPDSGSIRERFRAAALEAYALIAPRKPNNA